ncbi:MAG: hypothetical protein N2643_03245 [Endomicrobia bacterium]|nr:hypothetical protein [Endomicrobiia bacterium]
MKRLIFFIFFSITNALMGISISEVCDLLEAGKFSIVKEYIDSNKVFNSEKNIYQALFYLYLGDYVEADKYINLVDRNAISDDVKFFLSYIPYIRSIISEGYIKYETKNFEIYLKGRDEILSKIIMDKLETIHKRIGQKFNFAPTNKIRVEVYNKKDEFYIASTLGKEAVDKKGIVGICKFNRIMILSPECLPYGYRWVDTLSHEYIHYMLNHITEYKYPLYLHEATARYYDTLYRSTVTLCFTPGNIRALYEAKENNNLLSFDKFKGSLVYLETEKDIELAFVELASFIDCIIKNFGEDKLIEFITNYKEYYNNENELYNKIFGVGYEGIINIWYSYLDDQRYMFEEYPGATLNLKILDTDYEKSLLSLDLQQYIKLGDKFLEKKQYKSALYQYKKAQQQQNYHPVVMCRIAKVLILQGEYLEAEKYLSECYKVNPDFIYSYELLLELFYNMGKYDRVLDIYKEILDMNPFNTKIRKIVAEVYSDLGKLKEALNEYRTLFLLNPQDKKVLTIINSIEEYLKVKKQNTNAK